MTDIVKFPDAPAADDDDSSDLYALLQIAPRDALQEEDYTDGGDCGVDVVMVGVGAWFKRRVLEYQERFAAAQAEYNPWDATQPDDLTIEQIGAKCLELELKYDVHLPFMEGMRFLVVKVLT